MPDVNYLRGEIDQLRRRIARQRKEIQDLRRAGIPATAADQLLERMLANVDRLCVERDREVKKQRIKYPGTNKFIRGPIERRIR